MSMVDNITGKALDIIGQVLLQCMLGILAVGLTLVITVSSVRLGTMAATGLVVPEEAVEVFGSPPGGGQEPVLVIPDTHEEPYLSSQHGRNPPLIL